VASAVISYVGFKWPAIKLKISASVISRVESVSADFRYRVAFVLTFVLLFVSYLLIFLYGLRSDFDAYVLPRKISEEQTAKLKRSLEGHDSQNPIYIVANLGDEEAQNYAVSINTAITRFGLEGVLYSRVPNR